MCYGGLRETKADEVLNITLQQGRGESIKKPPALGGRRGRPRESGAALRGIARGVSAPVLHKEKNAVSDSTAEYKRRALLIKRGARQEME